MNTDPLRTARWAGLAGVALIVAALGWSGTRLVDAHEPIRHVAPPSSVPSVPPRPRTSASPTARPTTSVSVSVSPPPPPSTGVPASATPSGATLTVPPLVGQPADEAASVLRLIGLRPSERTVRDDAHAPGTVLVTVPAAGSSLDPGATVVVIVAAPPSAPPVGGSTPPSSPPVAPTTPTPPTLTPSQPGTGR